MSPLVSLPKPLRDGIDPQSGADVLADLNAILAVLNGGIDAANISPTAGIPGTRLSNVNGSQIPTDRLADSAVTFAKLKADATTGAPNAAIQNATVIKDGAITGKKLAVATLGGSQLRLASFSWVIPGPGNPTLAAGTTAYTDTGILSANVFPLGVTLENTGAPGPGIIGVCGLYLDTATDHYYIYLYAPQANNISGARIVFHYLTLAST